MNNTCLIYGMPVEKLPFGYDENDELCVIMKLKIAQLVAQLSASGITNFVTDCEFGVPMWGAEIVLAQKIYNPEITLMIYIPHEEQSAKWASDWRDRYFSIHERASTIVIMNNYKLCMDRLCDKADTLIYIGEDSAEVFERFYKSKKIIYRIIL